MTKPLIVTLQLDKETAQYFNELRKQYFPAHINYLDAHLTMFHALPANETVVQHTIGSLCRRRPMELIISGLKNIGNGVAYSVVSEELLAMHAIMQKSFEAFLIGKDKQEFWPHITIQNKVTAFKARSLFEELSAGFSPFPVKATGISIFVYEGGPWSHLQDFPFVE